MSLEALEGFKNGILEAKKKMQEVGKETLLAAAKELFVVAPGLLEVTWVQYTPWFNDGEPCVFQVHDVYFKDTSYKPDEDEDEDSRHDFYNWPEVNKLDSKADMSTDYWKEWVKPVYENSRAVLTDAGAEALLKFGSIIETLDQELEPIFGDGYRIRITKDGVDIEEYEHD